MAIFVEAGRRPEDAGAEIEWIRREARLHPWIRGAVAHAPVEGGPRVGALIRRYTDDPFVVGVRRNLYGNAARVYRIEPALPRKESV